MCYTFAKTRKKTIYRFSESGKKWAKTGQNGQINVTFLKSVTLSVTEKG